MFVQLNGIYDYFRQIWFQRQNEKGDDFSCPRYHRLHSKEALHGRRSKEG
jgi:hypothetical protein